MIGWNSEYELYLQLKVFTKLKIQTANKAVTVGRKHYEILAVIPYSDSTHKLSMLQQDILKRKWLILNICFCNTGTLSLCFKQEDIKFH
jgi:hypothetical protein